MAKKNDDGLVFRVPTAGGEISTVSREDAVKAAIADEIFDAETVTGMLDGKEVAFSNEFYFATEPDLLSKWASKPYTNGAGAATNDGAVDLESLKAQFPDQVKDTYANEAEADKAFMLGDNDAASRIVKPKGKPGRPKKEVPATEAPEAEYYRMLGTDTGTINPVTIAEVKDGVGKKMTAKTLDKFIADGRTFSGANGETFGKTEEALIAHASQGDDSDFEPETEAPASTPKVTPAGQPRRGADLEIGDRVINIVTKATGVVIDRKGTKVIETQKAKGGGTKYDDLKPAWEVDPKAKVEAVVEETAIAKSQPEEIVKPLTATETKRLEKLEAGIEKAKDALDNAPLVMGAALDEIRQNKLFRETAKGDGSVCRTFGEYAEFRFGITREYAQNIAQISGYMDIANEAIEGGDKLNVSIAVANAMVRDTNKISKALGLSGREFDVVKPIIVNATALLVDIAPKDAAGNPVITPRLVDSFNEKLREHIHGGMVEIDGKQMTLDKAREKGLLNDAFREEVITQTAEGILRQGELIKSEAREAFERQTAPVNNGDKVPATPPQFFRGEPSDLTVECSRHGETAITSIGTGRMQTKCKCRWHIDAESGMLVNTEVNGKRVKLA